MAASTATGPNGERWEPSEAELSDAVLSLAVLRGWRVHHCRPGLDRRGRWKTAIQGEPGFPDLVLARRGRVLFWEVKTRRGLVAAPQLAWALALGSSGREEVDWALLSGGEGCYAVVRPVRWQDGSVARVLAG